MKKSYNKWIWQWEMSKISQSNEAGMIDRGGEIE